MIVQVKTFSLTPGARYRTDGEYSGQEFYENFLEKAFEESVQKKEKLTVDLDGTEGYATSFLDEAFGRLAEKFGSKVVMDNLEIISDEEPDWIEEIHSYIMDRNEK